MAEELVWEWRVDARGLSLVPSTRADLDEGRPGDGTHP